MTVAIITTKKNGVYETQTKSFSTMSYGILEATQWLKDSSCPVAGVIESTGKYWIPVYNLMEDKVSITLANPSYTKTFPGDKTDRCDAKWLAELYRLGLVLPSFIPSKDIRELRDLTRYRHKLVRMRSLKKPESIISLRSAILCSRL